MHRSKTFLKLKFQETRIASSEISSVKRYSLSRVVREVFSTRIVLLEPSKLIKRVEKIKQLNETKSNVNLEFNSV